MTNEEKGMAIEYFKFHRKIFCEDHLKICPENSVAYQATLKEKSFYDMAIKALEQESVIEKIRAEIMSKDGLEEALEIIDKYKTESEE